MKYNIVIDYIEASASNKTAKITITDENGGVAVKNSPISLPEDVFDKNLASSYFSLNGSIPKIRNIDFSETNVLDDFYDAPKFSSFTDFNEENENEEKIFFDNDNKDYVIHKRNIMFFPQKSDNKLGVDKTAFILYSEDYNKIIDILKQEDAEISFMIKKKRFSLFSIFENRDQSKRSDINGAYNTLKELWQKKKLYSSDTANLVSERLKAASKKVMSKIIKKTVDTAPEIKDVNIHNDNNQTVNKKTHEESEKNIVNENKITEVVSKKIDNYSGNDKNCLFVNNDEGMDGFIKTTSNNIRNLSPEFLIKFHSYFTIQSMEINENNILKSLISIGQNDIIKDVSFISNENGFFVQMFEDKQKTKPLASIAFDYETKKMSLRNEVSKILLSPNEENKKLMKLSAEYIDVSIHGEVLNRKGDSLNKDGFGSSLINFKIEKNGILEDINHSVAIFHELKDINENDLFKLDSKTLNLSGNGGIEDYLKDGILGVYDYSNLEALNFHGKNEELLNMNKEKPDVMLTTDDLEEIEPTSVNQKDLNKEPHYEKQILENNNSENVIIDNDNIPTATNNVSPFPKDYVRIMGDDEFDDVADRTLGVNMQKVKHQFLTNDPELTRIDITALEYEYFFKPFKEERMAAKKREEEENERNMQKQLLIAFKSQPFEDQIEILIHQPIEKRKEVFETENDPLVDIIYSQSLEEQIRILSKYSIEERVVAFEQVDLLEVILKKNNMTLDDIKKEEIKEPEEIIKNNENKDKNQSNVEIQGGDIKEETSIVKSETIDVPQQSLTGDLKSSEQIPFEPPVLDNHTENMSASKWDSSNENIDFNNDRGPIFEDVNWFEHEGSNASVPFAHDYTPPADFYEDMNQRDYSDGNIYSSQEFENCYSENAEKVMQSKNTLNNSENVIANDNVEKKDERVERKPQQQRMKP